MEKDDEKKTESQAESQEVARGETWQNPGDFPAFKGEQKRKMSDEEKEKLGYDVANLHAHLSDLRYAEMPGGRKKPEDDEYGKVFLEIEELAASDDADFVESAKKKIEEHIAELDQRMRTEIAAEGEKLKGEIEELRKIEVPDGKFKFPDEVFDDLLAEIDVAVSGKIPYAYRRMFEVSSDIDKLKRLIGEIDEGVGEKLWSLYSDPEISVGAHGTAGGRDTEFGTENGSMMKYGIGCPYYDVRRTVSFQDRGRIHAHGELSVVDLLTYSFGDDYNAISEIDMEAGDSFVHGDVVPACQYTVIVAIPKNYGTYNNPDLMTEDKIPVKVRHHSISQPHKMAWALRPEFIVGMVKEGRVNDIVWNPKFDAEHTRELSRKQAVINAEKAREEDERKKQEEAEYAAQREKDSKKLGNRIKRVFGKLIGKHE